MIAKDFTDPRVELAAEAHHNAKIALGLNVPAWRDLPDHQRHKTMVCMVAALKAADQVERSPGRRSAA